MDLILIKYIISLLSPHLLTVWTILNAFKNSIETSFYSQVSIISDFLLVEQVGSASDCFNNFSRFHNCPLCTRRKTRKIVQKLRKYLIKIKSSWTLFVYKTNKYKWILSNLSCFSFGRVIFLCYSYNGEQYIISPDYCISSYFLIFYF